MSSTHRRLERIGPLAQRYLGTLVTAVAVALLIALVPSVPRETVTERRTETVAAEPGPAATAPTAGSGDAPTGGRADPAVPAASPTGGQTSAAVPAATPTGGPTTAPVTPDPTANDDAEAGSCPSGKRQLSVSSYSVFCRKPFAGDNGGATTYGVTEDTITVTFRVSSSGQSAAVAATSPSLSEDGQDRYFRDLQAYADYFNDEFELYGRRVELVKFEGRGDWVAEYQGQNLAGAQSDADTARDLGAFADISSKNVGTTPPYAQFLAENEVISIGGVAASQEFYDTYTPFVYGTGSTATETGQWISSLVCQRMAGLPAIFAGDAGYHETPRAFGLLIPDNPDYSTVRAEIDAALEDCGSPLIRTYQYRLNLTTLATEAANAMAQMRNAGVTTVICACDTVSPNLFTQAADRQDYEPEWIGPGGDNFGQGYSQRQWRNALSATGTYVPDDQTEAREVFDLARPGEDPAQEFYAVAYREILLLFNVLQATGPNVTPETFRDAFFGLPDSEPGGDYGPWRFDQGTYTTNAGAQVGWWNPDATSPYNGEQGAWISCDGQDGAYRPWLPASGYGPKGTQLACFGR